MRKAGLAILGLMVCVSIASAQEDVRVVVSLNAGGVFTKHISSTNGVVRDQPTKSLAVFGTIQYHLTRMHSVELNIGHSNNSQIFSVAPDTYRVNTAITEFSGAYVFTPFSTKKWSPFLLSGLGGLRFTPGNTYIDGFQSQFGAVKQTPLAFLYGAGTDYHVWRAFSVRLQYRGFIYRMPDFKVPTLFTGSRGHMAEPSVGIAFKF